MERVLAAKRDDPQANVAALEQEIDDRVFRLAAIVATIGQRTPFSLRCPRGVLGLPH